MTKKVSRKSTMRTIPKSALTKRRNYFRSTKKIWRNLLIMRDGEFCPICGNRGYEVHHILPLAKGGPNELENMMFMCPECHKEIHRLMKQINT